MRQRYKRMERVKEGGKKRKVKMEKANTKYQNKN